MLQGLNLSVELQSTSHTPQTQRPLQAHRFITITGDFNGSNAPGHHTSAHDGVSFTLIQNCIQEIQSFPLHSETRDYLIERPTTGRHG